MPARPRLGGKVIVTLTLQNVRRRPQHVVVDFVVHFVKANGGERPLGEFTLVGSSASGAICGP